MTTGVSHVPGRRTVVVRVAVDQSKRCQQSIEYIIKAPTPLIRMILSMFTLDDKLPPLSGAREECRLTALIVVQFYDDIRRSQRRRGPENVEILPSVTAAQTRVAYSK